MSSFKRTFRASLVTAGVALACACSDSEMATDEPPGQIDAGEASLTDAGDAGTDAVDDAGPKKGCSASGLCIVDVPIEKRIGLTSVWGSSASDVWAVGVDSTIVHYDGTAWAKATLAIPDASPAFSTLRGVWLERPDDVWIVDDANIRHSNGWQGAATQWSSFQVRADYTAPVSSVRGAGGSAWLARGLFCDSSSGDCDGQPVLKIDGWSDSGPGTLAGFGPSTSTNYSMRALAVTRPGEVWAAGRGVLRAHLSTDADAGSDGGESASWQLEEHDGRSENVLTGVWGDEDVVWLVGVGGALRRMTPALLATKTFEVVASPVTADLNGVFGFGANDVWAVGDEGTVLHWDGESWTKLPTPFDEANERPRLFAVWGSSPGDIWIAGSGTMLHFEEIAK